MIIDDIKEQAKYTNVLILTDMDGVVAEFGMNEKKNILSNASSFYLKRRPIQTTIEIFKELSEEENITIGIVSNCLYEEQKQDKLKWLEINMPFVNKDFVQIIKLKEEKYDKDTKPFLKSKYIEKMLKNEEYMVYFFEDDIGIIRATQKVLPNICTAHFSMLLK